MAALTGRELDDSYLDIINIDNNGAGVDATLRSLQDGNGNVLPIRVSATTLELVGSTWPAIDGTNGQVLTTDGAGNITWADPDTGTGAIIGPEFTNNPTAISEGEYITSGNDELIGVSNFVFSGKTVGNETIEMFSDNGDATGRILIPNRYSFLFDAQTYIVRTDSMTNNATAFETQRHYRGHATSIDGRIKVYAPAITENNSPTNYNNVSYVEDSANGSMKLEYIGTIGTELKIVTYITGTYVSHLDIPAEVFDPEQLLTASDAAASDWLGIGARMSKDGNYIIAGAGADDLTAGETGGSAITNAGSAYVFFNNAGTWIEQQKIWAPDAQASAHYGGYDWFGSGSDSSRQNDACDINIDGSFVTVGSRFHDVGNITDAGQAYVWGRVGSVWSNTAILASNDRRASDYFGMSTTVSDDGQVVAVGAHGADLVPNEVGSSISNAGAVYVFRDGQIKWLQQQKVTNSDGAGSDNFGISVDVSADGLYSVVGAQGDDDSGSLSGAAYIFFRPNTSSAWTEQQKLIASDGNGSDEFGWSVAIDGTGETVVVGARYEDATNSEGTNNHTDTGAAYVFTRSGAVWTEVDKLFADDRRPSDYFGWSVDISKDGQVVAVGSQRSDLVIAETGTSAFSDAGAAFIYRRNQDRWLQNQKVTASDGQASDFLGWDLDISGDGLTAVLGAYGEDTGGSGSGAAYIYQRATLTDPWIEQQKIQASDADGSDRFGYSVAINSDGTYIIVGAQVSDAPTDSGAAYIFTSSGGTWTQQQKIEASDEQSSDNFGHAVDISGNGDKVIIGAPLEDTGGGAAGQAYIYDRTGTVWGNEVIIQSSDVQGSDNFGHTVAMSTDGLTVIVGAPFEDTGGSNAGAAYVFTDSGGTWPQQQKLQASDVLGEARFGYSVDIASNGDTVIVGAQREDTWGTDSGAAYIFTRTASVWTERTKIKAHDAEASDWYGERVAISGDATKVIVGTRYEDSGAVNAGAIYIYDWDGTNTTLEEKVWPEDMNGGDEFGLSVATTSDGSTVLAGSYADDDNGTSSGSGYFFEQESGQWRQEKKLFASNAAASDYTGESVAVDEDGNTVIVGSISQDGFEGNEGAAYVFVESGGTWSEEQILYPTVSGNWDRLYGHWVDIDDSGDVSLVCAPLENSEGTVYTYTRSGSTWSLNERVKGNDTEANDRFGWSAAISNDASRIIVGSEREDSGASSNGGAAYIFNDNAGSWEQFDKVFSDDIANSDYFGSAVSIDEAGDVAIISSYLDDDNGSASGSAYFFEPIAGEWRQEAKLIASNANSTANLGRQVDISPDGTVIVVSSIYEDTTASNSGAIYVFKYDGTNWAESQILKAATPVASDYLMSVKISADGSTIVAGSQNGYNAYVWEDTGGGVYAFAQHLVTTESISGSGYGIDVDVSDDGSTIVVGRHLDDTFAGDAGAAWIWRYRGSSWETHQKLMIHTDEPSGADHLGQSVSLSGDGLQVLLAAPYYDTLSPSASNGGGVFTYKRS